MVDYENMSILEVQRLAKQGDKDALYEMRYRYPDNEEASGKVWAAYWDEKAAAKGHIYAKKHLAGFFQNMPVSVNFSKNRQKAMGLLESIVKDYEAGKLDKDDISVGIVAKLELGIMFCEGLGTERDCKRGIALITKSEEEAKPFGGLGYGHLCTIGELYGQGFAQDHDVPAISDLKKSIEYLESAVKKSEGVDPKRLDLHKRYLDTIKNRLRARENGQEEKAQRREKYYQPTENGRIIEDSITRLRERLVREGW